MKEWHCASADCEKEGWQSKDAVPFPMDSEDAAIEGIGVQNAVAASPHGQGGEQGAPNSRDRFLAGQIERWLASMERLQLSEYIRYVNDRKRMLWSNFFGGLARGLGTAVGFTILGAILVLILQNLAKHNLPLIGDALAQIVSIVQKRLQ